MHPKIGKIYDYSQLGYGLKILIEQSHKGAGIFEITPSKRAVNSTWVSWHAKHTYALVICTLTSKEKLFKHVIATQKPLACLQENS